MFDFLSVICIFDFFFLGKTCEINVNECMSNPCQNNATCIDDVNGYVCECLHGFRGNRYMYCTYLHVCVCNMHVMLGLHIYLIDRKRKEIL